MLEGLDFQHQTIYEPQIVRWNIYPDYNICVFSQRALGQRGALAHPALQHMYPSIPAAPHPALVPRESALPAH